MRPRQQRSFRAAGQETRRRLTEAALDCLIEFGLSGVSFVAVCNRVGLTRGAIHHHFDDVTDLLRAVFDRLFERLETRAEALLTEVSRARPSPRHVVETLRQVHQTPEFKALLQARIAAAKDPRVLATLLPVLGKRTDQILLKLAHLDPGAASGREDVAELALRWKAVLFALMGVAISEITGTGPPPDDPGRERLLALLSSVPTTG